MNLPIIDAVEAALIEAELTPGRFLRNTNKGHNSLYIVDAHSCRSEEHTSELQSQR